MPLAVCATPIGNLGDVTLRVLEELREADLVLCEDTRRSQILLDHYGIASPLLSFHGHNEAKRTQDVIARLERDERIALISDAGLPGVNDPGARLIGAAVEAGLPISVLPGASAVETALVASGLVSGRYQFIGYLPRRKGELDRVADELSRWPHSVVAFESPRRLPTSLAALAAVMPARSGAICRELTKRFEEIARGTLDELAERFAQPPKGEIAVVLGSHADGGRAEAEPESVAAVAELVAAGVPRRQAVDLVAKLAGESRNALYRASL